MKMRLTSLLTALVLMLALTLSGAAPAATPERHPAIRKAIVALEAAKNDLEHAAHDLGGHREEAIEAINHALDQLHKALEYDRIVQHRRCDGKRVFAIPGTLFSFASLPSLS